MEAAVRTVHEIVTGKELPRLKLDAVGGVEGTGVCERVSRCCAFFV